jgi:hydrogenase-4 component B
VTFLALPRGEGAAKARESPFVMLVPQAFLALACLVLGLAPGFVLQGLRGVAGPLPGVRPPPEMVRGMFTIAPGPGHFDHLSPVVVALAVLLAVGLAGALSLATGYRVRRVPTWGCGGELSARTEYTATAFSKPLMMIFRAIYRPTRVVQAVGEAYFPREVRYRAEIEPTFERFVYGPLTRGVLRTAERMKVIQAGSLHAYLAYVIVLVLSLVLLLWWRG